MQQGDGKEVGRWSEGKNEDTSPRFHWLVGFVLLPPLLPQLAAPGAARGLIQAVESVVPFSPAEAIAERSE
jgi:hypothetical protein